MSRTKRKDCADYQNTEFANNRDKKKWYKPNKGFKQKRRKVEKAKVKHLIRNNKFDQIVDVKHNDVYDYN